MKLYVGRHCFAGDPSDDPKVEMSRPLVPEGVAMAKAIASAMGEAGEIPSAIFCSNYARATQTAMIYGKILGVSVSVVSACAPQQPLTAFIASLVQTKGQEKVKRPMILGHVDNMTPTMRDLGDGGWEPMVMGEVRRVKMSRSDLSWTLQWSLKPSDLGLVDHAS